MRYLSFICRSIQDFAELYEALWRTGAAWKRRRCPATKGAEGTGGKRSSRFGGAEKTADAPRKFFAKSLRRAQLDAVAGDMPVVTTAAIFFEDVVSRSVGLYNEIQRLYNDIQGLYKDIRDCTTRSKNTSERNFSSTTVSFSSSNEFLSAPRFVWPVLTFRRYRSRKLLLVQYTPRTLVALQQSSTTI